MTSPLLGSLAATIGKAMALLFLDATLTRNVQGTGSDPADPPAPTQVAYSCKAIVETYDERFRLAGLVALNERRVMILASSLSTTPVAGDRVEVSGTTFTLSEVMTDPAQAVWECKGMV